MGEYAEMAIDESLNQYLDELDGNYEYDYDEVPETDQIPFSRKIKFYDYEFKSIKNENGKAWLLEMGGGAFKWFPKSQCRIEGNIIYIPKWLNEKITTDEAIKKIKNDKDYQRGLKLNAKNK